MSEPKVTKRKLSDFAPASVNPNAGTERGVPAIVDSLHYNGAGRSLLADKDGEMIAGSHTLQALIDAGFTEALEIRTQGDIPIIVTREDLDLTTDARAKALQIADNRTTIVGFAQDDLVTAALLADIAAQDEHLLRGAGFYGFEIDELLVTVDAQAPQLAANGGARERGLTPAERLGGFLDATIKQVVLYFDNVQYEDVINRLATIRRTRSLESNTDVFLALLEHYENTTS